MQLYLAIINLVLWVIVLCLGVKQYRLLRRRQS